MLNFPCSLTRNNTWYSRKNLAFHSLLGWKMIILPILTSWFVHFFIKVGRMHSELGGWKERAYRSSTVAVCKSVENGLTLQHVLEGGVLVRILIVDGRHKSFQGRFVFVIVVVVIIEVSGGLKQKACTRSSFTTPRHCKLADSDKSDNCCQQSIRGAIRPLE